MAKKLKIWNGTSWEAVAIGVPPSGVSASGGSVITASGNSVVPIVLKGASGQTANLQEWQNSSGAILSKVASNGSVTFGAADTLGSVVHSINGLDSFFGIYSPSNSLYFGLSVQMPAPSGTSTLGGYYKGLAVGGATHNLNNPIFGVATSTSSNQAVAPLVVFDTGASHIRSQINTATPLTIKGASSQTADLLQIQNSAGTSLVKVDPLGQIISIASQGTAPFSVASTTVVTNLNVGYLQGTPLSNVVYGSTTSGSISLGGTQNLLELAQYKSGFWDVAPGNTWAPTSDWYWGTTISHVSNGPGYNYSAQIAVQNSNRNGIYVRTIQGGPTPNASAWSKILTENAATITGAQTISAWQVRNTYASTSTPSGGNDGDMWATYV